MSIPASEPWISVGRAPGHALDPLDASVIQDICETKADVSSWAGCSAQQSRFLICLGSQVVADYGYVFSIRDLT